MKKTQLEQIDKQIETLDGTIAGLKKRLADLRKRRKLIAQLEELDRNKK